MLSGDKYGIEHKTAVSLCDFGYTKFDSCISKHSDLEKTGDRLRRFSVTVDKFINYIRFVFFGLDSGDFLVKEKDSCKCQVAG